MDREKLFHTLWERSGGRCMRCGRPLDPSGRDAVIDHIFPRRYGGTDRAENLRLLCSRCNCALVANLWLTNVEFQQYLAQFLQQDGRFADVRTDVRLENGSGERAVLDVTFSRTVRGREIRFAVAAKAMTQATGEAVRSAVAQLERYQRMFPELQLILAVPVFLAEEYRRLVWDAGFALWDSETLRRGVPDLPVPDCAAPDRYDLLIDRLKRCPPGTGDWPVYQRLVGEILTALFCPPLDPVSEQNADSSRANRRDFILPNYAEEGYWPYLRSRYQAEFIVVDAKNSAGPVGKDDILQVAHYLKRGGAGLFGLIFSRCGAGERTAVHLRDVWQQEEKMLVVLDDSDVEQMLLNRQKDIDPCRIIMQKIQEFRLGI